MIHKPQGRPLHPALFGNEALLQLLNISIILDSISPFVPVGSTEIERSFLTVLACHDLRYRYWWPKA